MLAGGSTQRDSTIWTRAMSLEARRLPGADPVVDETVSCDFK